MEGRSGADPATTRRIRQAEIGTPWNDRLQKKLGYAALCKALTGWRNSAETPWLREGPIHPLQQSLKDLDRAYANFFAKRADFPRFKKKGQRDSFRYPDPKQIKLDQGNRRLYLPKLGWLRFRKSREVLGTVKNVTVSQSAGRWFVSIQTEREVVVLAPTGGAVGIDLGVARFATLSDGSYLARLNSFKTHQAALRKAKQAMSRKVQHINEQIAQQTSRRLVDFALAQGADVIVLEDLKGWRPKAGKKRSGLRQRFHQWLHRRLTTLIEQKMAEAGGRVVYVYARGTSSWAFDGSGRVKRDKAQHELAIFPNGKQYNADLNASYNIGARYWAWKHKLTRRKDGQLSAGRSSPGKPRTPVTLSTLWRREPEAPHQCVA